MLFPDFTQYLHSIIMTSTRTTRSKSTAAKTLTSTSTASNESAEVPNEPQRTSQRPSRRCKESAVDKTKATTTTTTTRSTAKPTTSTTTTPQATKKKKGGSNKKTNSQKNKRKSEVLKEKNETKKRNTKTTKSNNSKKDEPKGKPTKTTITRSSPTQTQKPSSKKLKKTVVKENVVDKVVLVDVVVADQENDNTATEEQTSTHAFLTSGCLFCGTNDNEDQILLCELCDGEYHTYCLQPALRHVPEDDWYCDKCIPPHTVTDQSSKLTPNTKETKTAPTVTFDDTLDDDIATLSLTTSVTDRYGEVCWGYGGGGYGWWPCIIYDPRLTVGPARNEARRSLRSKHLVYFFQCPNSPFSVLPDKAIKPWIEGLAEDCHLGRAAKANGGRQRYQDFQSAFAMTCYAINLSKGERLAIDWESAHRPGNSTNSSSSLSVEKVDTTVPSAPSPSKQQLSPPSVLPSRDKKKSAISST